MTDLCYSFRRNAFTRERTFRIGPEGLLWSNGRKEGFILYHNISEVCFWRRVARGDAVVKGRTLLYLLLLCHAGQHFTLSPLHYARFRRWEDRSEAFLAFRDALMPRLHGIPNLRFITKTHWKLRLRNTVTRALPPLLGGVGLALLNLVRCLGLNRATRFSGRLMRSIGPFFPAHRVALANLKGAFPDKSGHEISKLVQGVWDNFGRVMVEYAFTDELYDYNPLDPIQKRILLDQATTKRLFAMRDKGEPMLFFSAHIGSWELSAVAASFDIPLAALYRPFRSQALDDLIIRRRGSGRINFVPARLGAAAQLEKLLQQGSSVGMLVDQHFSGGTDAMFFSRPCKVNPTLARLARKFECPIYGIRAIRLPHSRFSIEITPALVPPRDQDGKIDVVKTMQEITRIVEGWVREHPEQWLWLHRRWRDNRPL